MSMWVSMSGTAIEVLQISDLVEVAVPSMKGFLHLWENWSMLLI